MTVAHVNCQVKKTQQTYNHLTTYFSGQSGQDITIVRQRFNEERDDEVAVASAGLYANHVHLAPDR